MRGRIRENWKIVGIVLLFCGVSFLPAVTGLTNQLSINKTNTQYETMPITDDTEYWALIVAVGVYANNSEEDRPLMLEEVDDFYELLIESPWWSEDHIKVIKGEEATVTGIIKGLRWLDRMEDSDDISVVYITTHGFPLDVDIPPTDEDDGVDEGLVSYWGFEYLNLFIYDDQLNFLLNRLESQGVCFIVDSCYAGGFNDPPNWNSTALSANPFIQMQTDQAITRWIQGFGEEVKAQGRVVLMASCEDEVSYSGGFAPYLIDGFRGFGDTNLDGIVTAEEAFYYTEPRTYRQHPTMFDGYEGELPIIQLNQQQGDTTDEIDKTNQNTIQTQMQSCDYADETAFVQGVITESENNTPLQNAFVSVRGRLEGWEFYENETTTDINGYYSMNIPAGRFRVSAYVDGYLSGESNQFEIQEYEMRWVNVSLLPRPEETAMIYGYITENETGNPLDGAEIEIEWYYGQHQYYRNETSSDATGFYSINIAPGYFDIDFEAEGYFRESMHELYIQEGEQKEIDVVLYSRPDEHAMVSGYITDDTTGNPLSNVRVTLQWVDIWQDFSYENETYTDNDGFYSINIAAGEVYHDIRAIGYDYYNPYRLDIVDFETLWMNISLEPEIFDVVIEKPLNALYLNDKRLSPLPKARIFGPITIEVGIGDSDFWGGSQADLVEIYIDEDQVASLEEYPYTYTWDSFSFGKHTITAIAYDDEGRSVTTKRVVCKLF